MSDGPVVCTVQDLCLWHETMFNQRNPHCLCLSFCQQIRSRTLLACSRGRRGYQTSDATVPTYTALANLQRRLEWATRGLAVGVPKFKILDG